MSVRLRLELTTPSGDTVYRDPIIEDNEVVGEWISGFGFDRLGDEVIVETADGLVWVFPDAIEIEGRIRVGLNGPYAPFIRRVE